MITIYYTFLVETNNLSLIHRFVFYWGRYLLKLKHFHQIHRNSITSQCRIVDDWRSHSVFFGMFSFSKICVESLNMNLIQKAKC